MISNRKEFATKFTERIWEMEFYQTLKSSINQCCLCHQNTHREIMLCTLCENDIPQFNLKACTNNLLNWPKISENVSHQFFNSLIAFAPYTWPYSNWLPTFKYQQNFKFQQVISRLMTKTLPHYGNDWLVCPVPMHPNRWRERRFNQAGLIACQISDVLNLKYQPNLVQRIEHSEQQMKQSGVERRRNLKNNFQVNASLPMPEKVLLIDDVITTGTTVNLIAKALKKAGVTHVDVATLCLTLPH